MKRIILEGLPLKKAFKEPQYMTIPTRNGRENRPFCGLESGEHEIIFKGTRKSLLCTVKTWINPYGYAWQIIKSEVFNEKDKN